MTIAAATDLPLSGVRVVSVEQAVAAPLATRHLADLGADVVKLERTGEGDFARAYDTEVLGLASHFVWLNRGKRSVAIDLKSPVGADIARRLIARADVFVQNLAPGSTADLGLDSATLRRDNPSLIVVNITGYGSTGPLADHKAYDMLVQAETGLISITGSADAPAKTGIPTSDIAAAMYALTSVLSALVRKSRTDEGVTVDVSMFDATAEWLGHPMYVAMYGNRQLPRMGLSHATIAPYNAYPCMDGNILIGIQNNRGWQTLCREVLADPALADDPRFTTNPQRVAHRTELDAEIANRTTTWSVADLQHSLAKAGVAAGQFNDMQGLVDHQQLSLRDRWRPVSTPEGPVQGLLPPMTFHDIELPMGPVPDLGEHSTEVLTGLGMDVSAIEQLRHEGIIQ